MSAFAVRPGPCWELSHHDDWEWRPHFGKEMDAVLDLAYDWNEAYDEWVRGDREPGETFADERGDLLFSVWERRAEPCVELVCDGCGLALGQEGELVDPGAGMHIDPGDLDHVLECDGWTVDSSSLADYCPDCPPPPESEEDQRRRPGPLDVPLPFDDVRRCRVCGCTDDHACPPSCSWVAEDLCSACPAPVAP